MPRKDGGEHGGLLPAVREHGTHHRGQIALLVREAGGTPLPLDYIAFARETPLEG